MPPTVFAAASLGDALQAVFADWPGGPVRISAGGSGALARQVDQGAPADAIVLANPLWMDWLMDRGRIAPDAPRVLMGNALVLAGPPGAAPLPELTAAAILDRLGPEGRLAMGEHRAVPAGQYAREWLEAQGLWQALRPRLAEVENVRAALALVSRGEVPLAIVYRSDLTALPDEATPVWIIPDDRQPDIAYVAAPLTPAGAALVDHLTGPAAAEVFARFGFTPVAR